MPVLLASFFDLSFRRITLTKSALFLITFFLLYFTSTVIRWYGPIGEGFSTERLLSTISAAYNAGFERHAYIQFTSVMEYFHGNSSLGPNSLMRLMLLPFDRLLGTDLAPANPMYLYSEISQTSENAIRSSAHPLMYGDFYGQIGAGMVFVPSAAYLMAMATGRVIRNNRHGSVLAAGLFIFMALIVRGSSYYALMYLALGFVLMGLSAVGSLRLYRIRLLA